MGEIRDKIVDYCLWGCAHEPDIHYSQGGHRFDAIFHPRTLPLYTDCSGFATLACADAGAPDPNGLGYNGFGFTGTLLNYLPEISLDQAQKGDLIVYGPGSGDHVVIVVEPGSNPMTVSHGQEKGPIKIRHSAEVSSHRAPFRVLRVIGDEEMADSDEILSKVNQGVMLATAAANDSKAALDKVAHVEAMVGSLITALKTSGTIK